VVAQVRETASGVERMLLRAHKDLAQLHDAVRRELVTPQPLLFSLSPSSSLFFTSLIGLFRACPPHSPSTDSPCSGS
jgi:hypothetical protein